MPLIAVALRVALQLPPRRAASECAKIPSISRAEGGQLQAPVGRAVRSAMLSLLPSILKHIAVQAHDLSQRGIHIPHFDILRMRARHGRNARLA